MELICQVYGCALSAMPSVEEIDVDEMSNVRLCGEHGSQEHAGVRGQRSVDESGRSCQVRGAAARKFFLNTPE